LGKKSKNSLQVYYYDKKSVNTEGPQLYV